MACLILFAMQKKRALIFDLDGTLVDAYPAIIRSFNYTMRKLGLPGQPDLVIRRAVGEGDENLLKPFIRKADLKPAVLIYRQHHRKSLKVDSVLFRGVDKMLSRFGSQGYKLAVASNRPTEFSKIIIRKLGLDKYFDYVLCADKLKQGKPHPEILRRILRRFSLQPKQALYVGDMVIDAQTGKRAGVQTVIVTTGSSSKSQIKREKPYQVISRICELSRIIS